MALILRRPPSGRLEGRTAEGRAEPARYAAPSADRFLRHKITPLTQRRLDSLSLYGSGFGKAELVEVALQLSGESEFSETFHLMVNQSCGRLNQRADYRIRWRGLRIGFNYLYSVPHFRLKLRDRPVPFSGSHLLYFHQRRKGPRYNLYLSPIAGLDIYSGACCIRRG